MKSTDLRAKARAIFGSAIAEPMPKQPNGAKALQQRANARPIPTYKVGGVVKKNDGGLLKKPVRGRSVTIPLEEEKLQTRRDFAKPLPKKQPKVVDFEPRQPKTGRAPANAPKPPEMTRGPDITVRGTPPTKPGREEAMMEARRAAQAAQAARRSPEADDVLITTRRGQRILDEQKKREGEMERKRREKQARADKLLGIPAQKNGGKAGKYANGGILDRVAQAISDIANQDKMKKYGIPKGERPSAPSGSGAQRSGSASGRGNNTPVTVTRREESVTVTPTAPKTQRVKLNEKPKYVKLNEKPKYVKLNAHKDGGKVKTSSDTARKLATEMGGMKKGGKAKDGLAVMIAVGKPVKKFMGGSMKARKMLDKLAPEARARMDASAGTVPAERPRGMIGKMMSNPKMAAAMEAARAKMGSPMDRMEAKMGSPVKKAVGGAGKTRKGQAPIKRAQGGAGKVRKGMMSPEGKILNAIGKARGK